MFFGMKVDCHQIFLKFDSESGDVITWLDDVIIFIFLQFCEFLWQFLKVSSALFGKLFLKHPHYHHKAITGLRDDIETKSSSDLALVFA